MTAVLDLLAALGRFGSFSGQLLSRLCTPPFFFREVLTHLWQASSRCTLPVVAVTFPFGMVISLQGLEIFRVFGAERLLSSLVSVAVLRELAPVLACVLVAAQGGSSCAAALGSMRIKEEIDATEVMAIDGLRFHALPRVLGLAIACPLVNVAGSVAGVAGGYVSAVLMRGEPGGVFVAELWRLTSPIDVWAGLVKTMCFGLVIGLIAAFNGYNATGGASGVGRAVNDTVVYSILAFISLNYFLTSAIFGTGG